MLFAVLIGIFALIFISVYKEDRDSTNICNKIYRKLVSRDDLEHLNIAEWVDLEKTILEKWKYASESYSKTLLGRINARKEYDEEELREDRDSEEHFVDWSNAEPRIYGSHPSLFDEETHKQWLEEWRREMQQNRFSVRFKQLLREKNVAHPDVYKNANIDRKLFSKILSNESYVPRKTTVLALAVALKLDVDATINMLRWAGYTFSDGILSDIIVRFFIEKGIYDIDKINEALCRYDQKILGSSVREK